MKNVLLKDKTMHKTQFFQHIPKHTEAISVNITSTKLILLWDLVVLAIFCVCCPNTSFQKKSLKYKHKSGEKLTEDYFSSLHYCLDRHSFLSLFTTPNYLEGTVIQTLEWHTIKTLQYSYTDQSKNYYFWHMLLHHTIHTVCLHGEKGKGKFKHQ